MIFANQSLLLLVSKLDYCQRSMSFGYIIDGMTIPDNQALKKENVENTSRITTHQEQ